MKSSSISVSNAMILSLRELIAAVLVTAVVTGVIYYGWDSWERYSPGPDHRETCWAELQSDYWAYMRWCRYAREHYDILLMGDSVIWGQEVANDETISHYLNEFIGMKTVANMGNDGLFMAGLRGIVKYYDDYLDDTNVILQFNPLWMSSPRRDLRGETKSSYHHPRLIPQFDPRITYYHDLNTRVGYQMEHYFRVFPFVRHLMANYYENTSISGWMMNHPYECPISQITFKAAPVMAEKQGRGIDWEEKEMKMADDPFVDPAESIQFECFMDAVEGLKEKNTRVFVMIGPYNQYYLTPESRERLFLMIEKVKAIFDERGIPWYDTFESGLPSKTFGDSCHLLKEGHLLLAREMAGDPVFRKWLEGIR